MDDEERDDRELSRGNFFLRQPIASRIGLERPAVEDVKAWRLRRTRRRPLHGGHPQRQRCRAGRQQQTEPRTRRREFIRVNIVGPLVALPGRWGTTVQVTVIPDTDLMEFICSKTSGIRKMRLSQPCPLASSAPDWGSGVLKPVGPDGSLLNPVT